MIFCIKIFFGILIIKANAQTGRKLGDECIPGMCSAMNSNCKWNGNLFKCVCKDKFLAVNQTHCGHPMSNIEEQKCRNCLEKDSLCLDFDNDGITDECWCPKDEACGNKIQGRQNSKVLKNIDITMVLFDAVNNRPILDGNSVFIGDQVMIDIKTIKKENDISLTIENCSISALSNSEDVFVEKIDLIKRGCSVPNDINKINLNFRSISDNHIESNVFEIFKLKSSSTILISCWVQICSKKCPQQTCNEQTTTPASSTNIPVSLNGRNIIYNAYLNGRNLPKSQEDGLANSMEGNILYKDAGIRVIIEDPYGGHQSSGSVNNNQLKNNPQLPHVIELEFKTRPFSGLIKSAIVSCIAIIFAIIVSIISILVYRACVRDTMLNITRSSDPAESVCPTSESCKYEMNARHLQESFMHNQIDHQNNHNHNARW